MFGNFVQKLQSLSPLGSPITSPVSSPKSRRKFPVKSPRWRRREEYREVQSDPELDERDSAGGKDKRKKCERLYDVPQRRSKPMARASNGVLQGSKSLGRLDGMREAQRLAQYEHYLQSIVDNTRHDHPDVEDLAVAKAKAKQIVKRGEQESDLERIQDLFPNDCLRLHDKDVLTMKMKGLMRKRSTTAARLQRALSAKALRPGASEGSPEDPENGLPPGKTRKTQQKRQFLMETAVQFTTGVQSQERHLFLFTDLLLVAKARSGGNFKLKEKVRVSEMWLSRCVDDVIEVMKSHDTSFVMGWPTTNVAATFSTQAARDIWWNKLNEVITIERDKEPKSTNIQVLYYDVATNIEYCKTFSIGPSETARSCIRLALDHLEMRGLDPADFQLWAKTGRDESPYPLIGHERPFSIKLSCLRDALSAEEGFDLDHCNNIYGTDPLAKCQFILRNVRKTPECPSSDQKKGKKPRKSPMKIRHVFRRSGSKGEDGVYSSGYLFGVPLTRLCDGDNIPKPVMSMLQQVFMKGPFTQGIFRKSANARLVRELREKMDSTTEDLPLDHVPVLVTAALLKDFLRSLPDPLLVAALYSDWMEAIECSDDKERILRLKAILQQLPKAHQVILQHFLCILHHIALRASENLMSPSNLAVCVGPSLLWVPSLTPASSRAVPALVEILIDRCEELCGPNVVTLMGEPPERDPTRQDSGAEESDSLHSGNSLHSGGLRRDDSSIDSLERELMEPSPLPRKDKMSLSRDSGLTMSDSQLYTPDEEESESTSSGHSGEKSGGQTLYRQAYSDYKSQGYNSCYEHSKITGTFSHPLVTSTPQKQQEMKEYVRVYSGWEERIEGYRKNTDESIYAKTPARLTQSHLGHGQVINPNFQRQDWFRQRSHLKKLSLKQGQYLSSNNDGCVLNQSMSTMHNNKVNTLLRRSASEESLLNSYNVDHLSANPKRPALHRKGRAPAPPPIQRLQESTQQSPRLHNRTNLRHQLIHHYSSIHQPPASMLRSKSAHHLYSGRRDSDEIELLREPLPVVKPHQDQKDWSRSQSTPHIDEVDCSYDSSTLSDDDSTPHVSRSNSRGKDCTAVNTAWESVYGSLGSGSGSQSGTPRSSLSTLETTVAGSTTSSGSGSNAPNYKDTITRRHRHAASDQEQGNLSSRSKQLYEESLRIYGEKKVPVELVHAAPIKVDSQDSDSDHQTPPPLPPKAEAPPLPPKQRLTRRSFPSTTAESGVKLRHLPPVHVNIEGSSPSVPRNKLPRPVSYHADLSFLHTVQRSEPIYAPVPRARRTTLSGGMSTSCATETSYTEHQKVQTDANVEKMKGTSDDCGVKDEGIQTRGWEGSVERKRKDNEAQKSSRSEPKQTEHRSRLRRRDAMAGSAQRSKSLPPSEKTETEEEPPKKEFHERLNLRSEISWSVSQLRTLFGGNSNRKSSGSSGPPPYRPPPSVIRNSRAPITTYHLGNSQSEVYVTKLLDRRHKRCDSTDSNYGEESYV